MPPDTALVTELDRYLAGSPAAARVAEVSLKVDTKRWQAYLSNMPVLVDVEPIDGVITRTALFDLAAVDRQEQSDRSVLQLFWNTIAWGIAGSYRNVPRLVTEVRDHTSRVVSTLREAQALSFEGREKDAFSAIDGKIKQFGPAFFTKFLYFTADQERVGHALTLDDRVRVAWRILAGYYLRYGSAKDYERYCTEAGEAAQRLGLKACEVEACLYHLGRKVDSYEDWLLTSLELCRDRLGARAPSIAEVLVKFAKPS